MTYLDLHQKIEQQISQLPPEQLSLVSDFLDSIQEKSTVNQRPLRRISPIKRGKKAGDLLHHTELGMVMIWKIVCVSLKKPVLKRSFNFCHYVLFARY